MRDLELLGQYLLRLRQERLQQAHSKTLEAGATLLDIKVCAFEAELCNRIHAAVKVLARDAGAFIQEYLPNEHQ